MTRQKTALENITNIMVLVVAFVALCLLALNYFSRTAQPKVLGGLTKGMEFPALPTVKYDGFKGTVLIVLNTNCSYCSESVPFYTRLNEAQRQSDGTIQIVAIFPNGAEEVETYLKQHQLEVESVPDVKLDQMKLSATPSLLLIDPMGRLKDFWVGKVPANNEQQVADIIFRQETDGYPKH